MRTIRYLLEFAGVLPLYLLLAVLPHGAMFFLGRFLGALFFLVPPVRKLMIANLKLAFPEKDIREIKRIGSESAKNTVLTALELFWFARHPRRLDDLVEWEEEVTRISEECKENGQGCIWITMHLGNWELAGQKFKEETDTELAVVVRPMNNPLLEKLIFKGRNDQKARVIPAKGAVRGVIRALKEGCFAAILVDQNTRGRDGGIFADFFGLPVATTAAPALFARKLDIPIALGGCLRTGRKYRIFVSRMPKKPGEYSSDSDLMDDLIHGIEQYVREHPEQYLWLYERWRYIPRELPDELKKKFPYYADEVTPRFYSHQAPKENGKLESQFQNSA